MQRSIPSRPTTLARCSTCERLALSLACEQALHLGESREVTREQHARGDALVLPINGELAGQQATLRAMPLPFILFRIDTKRCSLQCEHCLDYEQSLICPQGQQSGKFYASARENHHPTEKGETRWGDIHARSSFARSTIPEEKWGTTRSLTQLYILLFY